MDPKTRRALEEDFVVDITTKGKSSGKPHRIEIWLRHVDGKFYLAGQPGTRDWYANLMASPRLTIHLKKDVKADVPATGRPVLDEDERRAVYRRIFEQEGLDRDLEAAVKGAPLVEVEIEER